MLCTFYVHAYQHLLIQQILPSHQNVKLCHSSPASPHAFSNEYSEEFVVVVDCGRSYYSSISSTMGVGRYDTVDYQIDYLRLTTGAKINKYIMQLVVLFQNTNIDLL